MLFKHRTGRGHPTCELGEEESWQRINGINGCPVYLLCSSPV